MRARGRQEGERGWDAGRDGQAGPGCLVTDSGLLSPLAGLSSSEPGLAQEWNAVEGDESKDSQVSWGSLLFHRCPPTPCRPQQVAPVSPPAWGCELRAVSHGKEDIVLRWSHMEGGSPWRHRPSSAALRSSSSVSRSFACLLTHPSTLSLACSPTHYVPPSLRPRLYVRLPPLSHMSASFAAYPRRHSSPWRLRLIGISVQGICGGSRAPRRNL